MVFQNTKRLLTLSTVRWPGLLPDRQAVPATPDGVLSRESDVSTPTGPGGPGRQTAPLQRGRLLSDHVEQGLALLVANRVQRTLQRRRYFRRVLDPFSVTAGGLADQLILERLG